MSLHQISLFLMNHALPVFMVGGSVRECLLDKQPEDIDLIVSQQAILLAQKLAKKFQLKWIVLDEHRDIARVFSNGMVLDIAAYGANLNQDLKARDLTVNAMACPVSVPWTNTTCILDPSQLIDPCLGLSDLQNRVLRGVAYANFASDPLRLLRLFRFAVTLDFQIDQQTLGWVKDLKASVLNSSPERILAELSKLLSETQTADNIGLMSEVGLAQVLFQQSTDVLRLRTEQLKQFERLYWTQFIHLDVLKNYLNLCLADTRQIVFVLKLALLIRAPEQDISAADLKNRYALSRAEIDCILLWEQLLLMLKALFKNHSQVTIMRFFRLGRQHALGALILFYLEHQPDFSEQETHFWWELLEAWSNPEHTLAHPVDLIDGRDILRELQMPAGPKVGRILEYIQEQQALGSIQNRQAALDALRGLSADDF